MSTADTSLSPLALPRRTLGATGMQTSCIGLGTVKFGRNSGVKYPTRFELPDDRTVERILTLARELGINLLDTAPAYGHSEERLGRLLTDRQDWLLCSKTGEEFDKGKSRFDFSAAHTRHSIERSLQRLRTDYLDLVMVHSDGNDEAIINNSDCLETLLRCRDEGLLRAVGFSGKTVAGGLLALQYCDAVMVTCNPQQKTEIPVIEAARTDNRGVLIKKALNSGHLASEQESDPVQEAMDFIFSQPGVNSVITGSINPLHLSHNVTAAIAAIGKAGLAEYQA